MILTYKIKYRSFEILNTRFGKTICEAFWEQNKETHNKILTNIEYNVLGNSYESTISNKLETYDFKNKKY